MGAFAGSGAVAGAGAGAAGVVSLGFVVADEGSEVVVGVSSFLGFFLLKMPLIPFFN